MVNRSEVYFDGGSSLCGNAPASNKSDGSEKFRMHYLKQRSHSDSGEFQVTAEPLFIPVDENSETSSPSYHSATGTTDKISIVTSKFIISCYMNLILIYFFLQDFYSNCYMNKFTFKYLIIILIHRLPLFPTICAPF